MVKKIGGRIADLIRLIAGDRYQPERHYMRGPGPATLRRQTNIAQKPTVSVPNSR